MWLVMNDAAEIRIVRAGPAEVRRLVALMPHIADQPTQYEFYAAVRAEGLLGGAALSGIRKGSMGISEAGFQVELDEIAPQSAGDMLVQAMKVLARRKGAELLIYQGVVRAGSVQEEMLERCNFSTRGAAISLFSVHTAAPEWSRFIATYEKLKDRGRIPGNAEIVSLNRVAEMSAAALLRRTIGDAGAALKAELLNPDTCSIGIKVGSSLLGVHVVSKKKEVAETSHLAIDAKHRGSWIYTALMVEVLLRLRAKELQEWHFKTNPGIHRAILNFANKIEAKPLGTELVWVFPLTGSSAGGT